MNLYGEGFSKPELLLLKIFAIVRNNSSGGQDLELCPFDMFHVLSETPLFPRPQPQLEVHEYTPLPTLTHWWRHIRENVLGTWKNSDLFLYI